MPYRIFKSQAEVAEYAASLDRRWPQRREIAEHISGHLRHLPSRMPLVVELCCGPGALASVLLADHPTIRYVGFDISAPSLTYAQERLDVYADRVKLVQSDLNEDEWTQAVSEAPMAIVSMQSLHDLGDEQSVARIYALARGSLAPGGLFVNADLLAHTVEEPGANPGRLSLERHMELLSSMGYSDVRTTLEIGDFGCVAAQAGL